MKPSLHIDEQASIFQALQLEAQQGQQKDELSELIRRFAEHPDLVTPIYKNLSSLKLNLFPDDVTVTFSIKIRRLDEIIKSLQRNPLLFAPFIIAFPAMLYHVWRKSEPDATLQILETQVQIKFDDKGISDLMIPFELIDSVNSAGEWIKIGLNLAEKPLQIKAKNGDNIAIYNAIQKAMNINQ